MGGVAITDSMRKGPFGSLIHKAMNDQRWLWTIYAKKKDDEEMKKGICNKLPYTFKWLWQKEV